MWLCCRCFINLINHPAILFIKVLYLNCTFFSFYQSLPVQLIFTYLVIFSSTVQQLQLVVVLLLLKTFHFSQPVCLVHTPASLAQLSSSLFIQAELHHLQATNRLNYSPRAGFCAVGPLYARMMKAKNIKFGQPRCRLIMNSLHDSKLRCQWGLIQ